MRTDHGILNGKVALVTGSASGMGYAITKLFAEEGARVVAVDINEIDLASWNGVENVVPVVADVTRAEDIDRMITEAENRFGRLDILCNVAGINDLCYPLLDTSDEMWDRVIDLDLKAPFRVCRRAIKGMVERGGGVILNIGSIAAYRGNHGPSYSAAKHGVVGLTLSIAVGFADKGIRCNVINPGPTNTNIGLHSGGNKYHPRGVEILMNAIGHIPVKSAEPEHIAKAALWLCCDDSEHINGAVVPVDAGLSAF